MSSKSGGRHPCAAWLRVAVLLALLLGTLPAVRAQGSVLVVDPIAGPFTGIQPAIDAAADGDTILVHAGWYGRLTLVGRALTIAAVPGAVVHCGEVGSDNVLGSGALPNVVADLDAGDTLVLRGLRLAGLTVTDAEGTVWLEDCSVETTAPALLATGCSRLVLARCTLTGPDQVFDSGGYFSATGGRAAQLADCTALLADCTVRGGNGKDVTGSIFGLIPNTPGHDALLVQGGRAWISGGSVQGGSGGDGASDFFCWSGLPGGHGLHLGGEAPEVNLFGASLAGGAGGTAPPSCPFGTPAPGANGLPLLVDSGSAATTAGPARHFAVSSPVVEGQKLSVSFAGQAQDGVLVLLGFAPGLQLLPVHSGALLVPAPPVVLALGSLGASGALDVALPLPELGPGVQAVRAFVQAAFLPAGGGSLLGPGSVLVTLDAQF